MTRLCLYTSYNNVVNNISPAQIKSWGISDVVASGLRLPTIGGSTTIPTSDAATLAAYHAQGIKVFRGVKVWPSPATPTVLVDWYDGPKWDALLAGVHAQMANIKAAGYDGIAFDNEAYIDNQQPSWAWDYTGNTHPEASNRYVANLRGGAFMQAIIDVWLYVEIISYFDYWPGAHTCWEEHVLAGLDYPTNYPRSLQFDFLTGSLNRAGYSKYHFLNAGFYKGKGASPPNMGWSQDTMGAAKFDGDLSRQWWDQHLDPALDKTHLKPEMFVAISPIADGLSSYRDALSVGEAQELLMAGVTMGEMVGIYHYGAWPYVTPSTGVTFDYAPYVPVLQAAAAHV